MSRIGNKEILVPAGVTVDIDDNNVVKVKGPKGALQEQISKDITIEKAEGKIHLKRSSEDKKYKSLHGLSRSLIHNMIVGVTEGYSKNLEIVGVGYRAAKQGKKLVLTLGYSHPVEMQDPEGIEVEVPEQNKIIVKGANKQQVGNYAAKIRDWRRPEPYKGKGIRYEGEYVRRKEGKTGKK